ncbi:hypothetical protein VZT92_005849 [Zoarces viviparus]|uniref:Uncharacterized protein n=1 Tax=Zoarces viviparus TaxID=48416 RepID=A0AAW1FMH0_ZOAVI
MEGLQDIEEGGSDDREEDKAEKHRTKKSALEELFVDEDRELLQATTTKGSTLSIAEQVRKEIDIYKSHAISQERCRILPEKANMLIFLQKNC